jgi:hypothetical protein
MQVIFLIGGGAKDVTGSKILGMRKEYRWFSKTVKRQAVGLSLS